MEIDFGFKNFWLMIIGHEEIIKDLKKLADKRKLSHGYIFWGAPNVGKKTVALSLANYLENGEFVPPKEKEASFLTECLLIKPDESGSIGIDVIRQIKYFLWQKPIKGEYRIAIVDDGDFLTSEAQSALLKITEEPSSFALIILIVKDPDFLLPTISSRLPKIYFAPVNQEKIKKWLKEEINCNFKEVEVLAKKSFGRPGLAVILRNDEKMKTLIKKAEEFLNTSPLKRKVFLKSLTELKDFNFIEFLDATIFVLANKMDLKKGKNDFDLWHRILRLRHFSSYFNLNPRIQLQSLFKNE